LPVSNPYEYGRPVMDPHLFAGRGRLLDDIQYGLGLTRGNPPLFKNWAITGPRGIGKTSLLNKVAAIGEQEYGLLASRVELNNELAGNQAALFHQLLEDIVGRLRERQAFGKTRYWFQRLARTQSVEVELNFVIGSLKTAQKDALQVPQERLRKSLAALSKEARAAGFPAILICFDEADLLARDETTLQALRNTFQQQDGYLLVLCGTERLLDNLGKVFGAMTRFFDQLKLGPLDGPSEVRECLQAPLDEADRAIVTESFAARVHALTGGRPYFVKLAAYHAYRALAGGGGSELQLTPAVEDAVLTGIQRMGKDGVEDGAAREQTGEPRDQQDSEHLSTEQIGESQASEEGSGQPDLVHEIPLVPPDADEAGTGDESPVIRLVNTLFTDALSRRATDLHIVPRADDVLIRIRVDGQLQPLATAPHAQQSSIAARLKIMGNLDIAERRVPQDGVLKIKVGKQRYDCRISTAPSIHGESIAIKLTDMAREFQEPSALGLDGDDLRVFLAALDRPSGAVFIAGPARSGRTTTYYAALAYLGSRNLNVLSAEDRVKSQLREVTQCQFNAMIGLTASSMARGFLRHDPDVVAVRPVSDADGSEQLIKIALAGRKALGVLFGDDAPSALLHLVEKVSIDRASVAGAITLVVAQRLLRRICEDCRGEARLGGTFLGSRCPACNGTGYRGQTGVYQLLPVDEEIRAAIAAGTTVPALRELATHRGMRDLRGLALNRVRDGVTTLDEVERVLPAEQPAATG
jgi:type IV pilus assembly protein PilB